MAAQTQAPLNAFLLDSKKNDKREIPWHSEAEQAFEQVKRNIADATLLFHPCETAETRLVTDASDTAMG